jgi:hypothetical protein
MGSQKFHCSSDIIPLSCHVRTVGSLKKYVSVCILIIVLVITQFGIFSTHKVHADYQLVTVTYSSDADFDGGTHSLTRTNGTGAAAKLELCSDPLCSKYSTQIAIDNTAGVAHTVAQVTVTINTASLITAGKMKNDCSDLRFYNTDNKTLINSGTLINCNASDTTVALAVTSIPAASMKYIYAVYGSDFSTTGIYDATLFQSKSADMQTDPEPGASLLYDAYWDSNGKYTVLTPNDYSMTGMVSWKNYLADNYVFDADIWAGGGSADATYFYEGSDWPVGNEGGGGYVEYQGHGLIYVYNEFANYISVTHDDVDIAKLNCSGGNAACNIDNSQWHHIKVEKTETNIKMYFDATKVIDYTGTLPTPSGPYMGIGSRTGGSSNEHRVKNITMTAGTHVSYSATANLNLEGRQNGSALDQGYWTSPVIDTYYDAYLGDGGVDQNSVVFQVNLSGLTGTNYVDLYFKEGNTPEEAIDDDYESINGWNTNGLHSVTLQDIFWSTDIDTTEPLKKYIQLEIQLRQNNTTVPRLDDVSIFFTADVPIPEPTEEPTPTEEPSPSPTSSPTPTTTDTPTPTPTLDITPTPTSIPVQNPTTSPTPIPTPTSVYSNTVISTTSVKPTVIITPSPSPTSEPITPTDTATPSPTPKPTQETRATSTDSYGENARPQAISKTTKIGGKKYIPLVMIMLVAGIYFIIRSKSS